MKALPARVEKKDPVASEEVDVVAVVVAEAVQVVPVEVPPRTNGSQRPSSADLSSTV